MSMNGRCRTVQTLPFVLIKLPFGEFDIVIIEVDLIENMFLYVILCVKLVFRLLFLSLKHHLKV